MVGGLEQTPLKYEKGARFKIPPGEQVDTSAIGRGTIDPIMSLWFLEKGWAPGSIITFPINYNRDVERWINRLLSVFNTVNLFKWLDHQKIVKNHTILPSVNNLF